MSRGAVGRLSGAVGGADGHVSVVLDGRVLDLHPVWLRDNCPCPACRVAETGEHRYFLGDLPHLPRVVAATTDGDALVVDFDDGHRSSFTAADLETLAARSRRRHREPLVGPPPGGPVARFDHDRVTTTAAGARELLTRLAVHGHAVVSGVPCRDGECVRFLRALGVAPREVAFGLVHDVAHDPAGYNVAHTAEALPPHNDFASYTWPPSGQVLHMLANEAAGGDTLLVDAFAVCGLLAERHPELLDVLARVEVAHREFDETTETWARAPLVRRAPDGRVTAVRFSNQLMQPLDPAAPDLDAFYRAWHALARAVADPGHQLRFRLEAGDLLVVHAHRMLHARTAYEPASGPRHLQDAYFDFDDALGRLAVLEGNRP